MPIREIARRTGLSRNTIRKYLWAEIVEPSFRTPTRPSKLDPFAEKLSGWLVMEVRKSRKDRRTATLDYIYWQWEPLVLLCNRICGNQLLAELQSRKGVNARRI
jgi:predicted transcriptional regulator